MNEYDEIIDEEIGDTESTEQKECFTVKDDVSADWVIEKIGEQRRKSAAFKAVCDAKIKAIKDNCDKICAGYEETCVYFEEKLFAYLQSQEIEPNKAGNKIKQFPSGKATIKKPAVSYNRDNDALLKWLEENKKTDYIKTVSSPMWGELKSAGIAIAEDNLTVLTAGGEVIEGVTAEYSPATLEIKVAEVAE